MPCRCSNCCHQAPDESHLLVELKFASTLPHFTLTFEERWDSVETLTNVKSRCGAPSFPSTLALYQATSRASDWELRNRKGTDSSLPGHSTSCLYFYFGAKSKTHMCRGEQITIKFVKDSITLTYDSCQSKTSSCVATRIHQMSLRSNILAATKRGFYPTYVVGKFL